jgi:adenylate kinase family enzyme
MRVAVIGSSGSGKSTLAKRLGGRLNLAHIELDAINWQPGWRGLNADDPEEFVRRVKAAITEEAWITDGNYSQVLPHILRRATHVVWLDYERPVIMRRVIWRSFRRSMEQNELWPGTGNRERWSQWLSKEHPIRWAWDTFERRRAGYEAALANPKLAHLQVHRLRDPREAEDVAGRLVSSPRRGEVG